MSFERVGRAENSKGGAVLVADDGVFYIAWKDEWEPKYENKRVRVRGVHRVEKHSEPLVNAAGEHSAGMQGDQHFIAASEIALV